MSVYTERTSGNHVGTRVETSRECGYCNNGRIDVDFNTFDFHTLNQEILQRVIAEEGVINNFDDFEDLIKDIRICQAGSKEIVCPVCTGDGVIKS